MDHRIWHPKRYFVQNPSEITYLFQKPNRIKRSQLVCFLVYEEQEGLLGAPFLFCMTIIMIMEKYMFKENIVSSKIDGKANIYAKTCPINSWNWNLSFGAMHEEHDCFLLNLIRTNKIITPTSYKTIIGLFNDTHFQKRPG